MSAGSIGSSDQRELYHLSAYAPSGMTTPVCFVRPIKQKQSIPHFSSSFYSLTSIVNTSISLESMVKGGTLTIRNVHLPSSYHDPSHHDSTLFDVLCEDGRIKSIRKAGAPGRSTSNRIWLLLHVVGLFTLLPSREIDAEGKGILLPSCVYTHRPKRSELMAFSVFAILTSIWTNAFF